MRKFGSNRARAARQAAVVLAIGSLLAVPTAADAGTNLGGGTIQGSVFLGGSGIPTGSEPCEPTTFLFGPDSKATGSVFNTVITGHVGDITLTGGGGSACENALTSAGTTITVTADGTGPTLSRVTCPSLTGTFIRVAAAVEVNVVGDCTVNNYGTGRVRLLATSVFVPTEGDGVQTRITEGRFLGNFVVIPA